MIGKTISHYHILEKLGEGGMGVVYKAEDTKLKRTVALKFLPPDLTRDREAKDRFIHEAQAASALEYNNICNIHEIDEMEDGRTFIAMACYEGEILKDKIQKGPLKIQEAMDIAIQIAQGLKKAHQKGIVHRDIKPANIFITDDGIVKILDFGLAKLAGRIKITKTGITIGTVAYMSPEQSRGKDVDRRADIWSERFDRELKDIFTIQDEISLVIVEKLKVQLIGEEKAKVIKRFTKDPEAYNLYLKGLYFLKKWSEEGIQKSLEYFQKAIEVDPNFALAYLGIADLYTTIGLLSLSPPQEIFPKARDMIRNVLEIDNTLYEAYGVSTQIAFWYDWNWTEVENGLKKVIDYNPGNARVHGGYAWYLAVMGRFDESITEIKHAQVLDPLLPLYYAWGTAIYTYAGRYDEAVGQFKKAVELEPSMGLAYFHVGNNYMIQKKYREAKAAFQKAIECTTGLGWAECYLGGIYHFLGDEEKATQILNNLLSQKKEQFISSFCIAALYNFLGEIDKAFDWLENAYQERDILMPILDTVGVFRNLRNDARFRAMKKKMGFEQ